MSTTKVCYYDAIRSCFTAETIQNTPIVCPHCKMTMIPKFLFMDYDERGGQSVFCRCTNPSCNHTFIAEYVSNYFSRVEPNHRLDKMKFSSIIESVSVLFCEIYNQAYAAHQMNLTQICGVGYRKALEFLIKDYIISKESTKEDVIKSKPLGKCIQEDVTDAKVKQVAERAVWLGNDETHYVRIWEDKDVDDLVSLIHLTVHWIESEIETEKLLESMSKRK